MSSAEFVFYPGGHSVARSEYLFPCMPYENYGLNRVGFFSGPETPAVYTSDVSSPATISRMSPH